MGQTEGLWGLGDIRGANDAFRDALAANKNDPARRVRWGQLFLLTDQPKDAGDLFEEALELNENYAPAMLGMASLLNQTFDGHAGEWAEKALKADPKMYQAYEIMAWIHLEDNNEPKAIEDAKALLSRQRYEDSIRVAAEQQVEAGDVANFRLGRLAHVVRRDQHRHRDEHGKARQYEASDADTQAFEAGCRGHGRFPMVDAKAGGL